MASHISYFFLGTMSVGHGNGLQHATQLTQNSNLGKTKQNKTKIDIVLFKIRKLRAFEWLSKLSF